MWVAEDVLRNPDAKAKDQLDNGQLLVELLLIIEIRGEARGWQEWASDHPTIKILPFI